MNRKPSWWTDANTSSWAQVKEALRRDWAQTRHDLDVGGHELNQTASDTLAQAAGEAAMPPIDVANRPTVIARWADAEVAIGFGYAARSHYGDIYPNWSPELERKLESDWRGADEPWAKVVGLVRHGYEVRH